MDVRRMSLCTFLAALLLGGALPAGAQEEEKKPEEAEEQGFEAAMMEAYTRAAAPGEEHARIARLAGSWAATVKMWMDPTAEPMTSEATMEGEMVMGGRFLQGRIEGNFVGEPFNGLWLLGYNNTTEQYESAWIDNHTTGVYVFTGSDNEAGDEFTFTGKHKNPATGEWVETRSVMKLVSPDEIVETAWEKRGDQEVKTMEIVYRRSG